MAVCAPIKKNNRSVCVGAMNKKIEIEARAITPPTFSINTDYNEDFTLVKTVWANIVTVSGMTTFDGTNVERVVTHFFYFRYIPNITFENWIKFRDEYYDIIRVEDLDNDNKFYLAKASKRGTINNQANLA